MKRTAKIITALFLALSLLLPYAVFAESGGIMEGIYEKLMAEDSEFTEQARLFDTYYDGASLGAALEGDSIVISLDAGEGNEYMESGSWTFTRDGDYLTTTIGGYDYYGASMLLMVLFAAGKYWEYDTSLLNSYLSGVEVLGVETPDYSCEIDSQTGDRTIRVYIAGKKVL